MCRKTFFAILLLGFYAATITGKTQRGNNATRPSAHGPALCTPMSCPRGTKYNCLIMSANSAKLCVPRNQSCSVAWQYICNRVYYTLRCCSTFDRCICHCDPNCVY
uniref:Uncharacterized protein n=1 Tax=Rhipicephalus appendiculatus TaxID=34631 RepID=A0A131YE64_RHIAP